MGRPLVIRVSLVALAILVASCDTTVSGPRLPRPQSAGAHTVPTTVPATTTTIDEGTALATGCPTPFCLVYHIDRDASWSDGEPVSSADFANTVGLHHDRGFEDPVPGYEMVSRVDVIDERTFRVVFTERFGAWQTLFDRVLRTGSGGDVTAGVGTTGPFTLVEWVRGDHMVLRRNPDWWSPTDPLSAGALGDVEELRIVFIRDLDEAVTALEEGEVDVITARPDDASVERLAGIEGITFATIPGPFWEHIDFHHDDPFLSQPWAREMLSLAIDREKILDRTIRLVDPGATALDNTIWMANTHHYEPHYVDGFDPAAAEQMLIDNGCVRDEGGIYVCQGRRMSFLWATTGDDPDRRQIFESAREDLAVVGVELVADFRTPSAFVTRDFLFGGPDVWQLINFSWRARSDPGATNATYYCDDAGDLNVNRYCSTEVEDLIRSTEEIIEPSGRAAVYNRADRLYLQDHAVIPLYQKPSLMAWGSGISGPAPNFSFSSDLWNVASWTGKESIVVALPDEPLDLDPRSQADDNANVVLGAILYGAFGMDPSHRYVPVLIESVDVIEGSG
ncbi:MAG TPA: ABC transporter substrate-binding protein [Acidimicrobiia bacterium]|nr:ABC transporter substrate-binding protein [Acidimicrobiia bacterium]